MKVILFANTDWYLYNFRLSLALALRDAGYEVMLISPPGEYGPKLVEFGFHWQPLPMSRRSLNPIRELVLLCHLVRVFRSERPLLVHAFTLKCAVYGSIAARLANVPARVNAVTGMGYVFTNTDWKARLLRAPLRALLRFALSGSRTLLILQNPDDVALLIGARLVDSNRVRLIPGSGVDLQRFLPAARPRAFGAPMTVLLAARLLWDKGLAEYAVAIKALRLEGRNLRFLLAGLPDRGNPAAVLESTLRTWVRDGLMEWLGHVDDMPTLLASVDVVVLPSYREGLPKTLIEGAACALPIVTTDVPGCREVVTHEVDGLLVPAKDASALAQAIARLQDDPALAQRLGTAARQKALAQFDERIVNKRTLEVYRELSHYGDIGVV